MDLLELEDKGKEIRVVELSLFLDVVQVVEGEVVQVGVEWVEELPAIV